MSQNHPHITEDLEKAMTTAADRLEEAASLVQKNLDDAAKPLRKHVFKRFPVVFLLAVTFGVIATSLGIELMLLKYGIFTNHPVILVVLGVTILSVTGKLYKKLD